MRRRSTRRRARLPLAVLCAAFGLPWMVPLYIGEASGAEPVKPARPVSAPKKRTVKPVAPAPAEEPPPPVAEPRVPVAAPYPPIPPPPPESNDTCSDERIDALVRNLGAWLQSFQDSERYAYGTRHCEQSSILCLDRFGEASADELPARAPAGQTWTVYAVFPAIDTGSFSVATSIKASLARAERPHEATDSQQGSEKAPPKPDAGCRLSSAQREALKTAALPLARLGSRPGLESLQIPAGSWSDAYWSTDDAQIVQDWSTWANSDARYPIPSFTSVRSQLVIPAGEAVSIDFSRTERAASTPSVERHYDELVDNGRYYLEPALLVPFIYQGNRVTELNPTTSGELELDTRDDWRVTGAAMINYFPGGRQKGQISSFRDCRTSSCVENYLGAQVGIGLADPLREWYVGLVFEPVSGLAFNFGGTLLKGDFLLPGRAAGMLLPAVNTPVRNSHQEYMLRPYVGFSLTLDITQTLDRAASSVKQLLF